MSSAGPRPELRRVIRDAMRRRGIPTVKELVDRAKVTRNTLYNWEGGKSAPALDQLDDVARALDVPLSVLVDAWSGRQTQQSAPPAEASGALPEWAQALQNEIGLNRMVIQAAFSVLDPGLVARVLRRLAVLSEQHEPPAVAERSD